MAQAENQRSSPSRPSPQRPIIIETLDQLIHNRISGDMPDDNIHYFIIANKTTSPVVWCIKGKDKMMRLSQSYGILNANEDTDLTLYFISSEDWPRDVLDYCGRRLQIVVESLKIPDNIKPINKKEESRIAREIFHFSSLYNPLLRMYTKLNIVLE
ncbi:hypothetical protein DICVIV_12737 [Dictyocaulus viviparus]|uniref:Uncharacterized protein n=1 Tax=Dictyocaulus viviparus TaxID=29172 RepID=A0A0D8X9M5_DICVI|nr:hypothetical protein DICVIV_12737 [Dictyocaulus viviparus]